MMNRNYLAKLIPVLSYSLLAGFFVTGLALGQAGASKNASKAKATKATAPKASKSSSKKAAAKAPASQRPTVAPVARGKGGELAQLVRAYRGSPSAARLTAVENYAASHRAGESGSLARVALGVIRFEKGDYPQAIAALESVKVAAISDYVAYYLAASQVEAEKVETVARDLAPVYQEPFASPLAGRARLVEARALKASNPQAGVKLLRDNYNQLPQPEGDLALADCYLAAKSLPAAAEYYQRVFYAYISGAAATRAAAALATLKDMMGVDYPPPLPQQMLQRADKLLDARDFSRARAEYESVIAQTAGFQRDAARVRAGAVSYLAGDISSAYRYLRGLSLSESEAEAERLYYLAECARRLDNDDEMKSAVKRLDEHYAKSPWRLKALIAAGNRYLLLNRPSEYAPFYSAAARDFRGESAAATAQWKVAFQAWMSEAGPVTDMPRSREFENLLREHVQTYPSAPTAPAAIYFLGRSAEQAGDRGAARAYYRKISDALPNTYYATQARLRLERPEITAAAPSARISQFLDGLSLRAPRPIPLQPTAATNGRIDRSRLLRTAGLNDLADSELRFGSRTDGQPVLLALEMARSADEPYQALRAMKSMAGDYLALALEDAPREFWELLFPLPFRNDLFEVAKARDVDPYLLAGLIRQESEFNPGAVSRANAYGLTQVRPATGRLYAQRAGVGRFRNALLLQPASNLRIGSTVLRSMLDSNGGKLEPTLAAYNAGPNRAAEWLAWNDYREPAEFVESIPFTETRDYVQAVLRNADIYRRLYAK
jgi:soluble lytic murein transglycosylase